MDAHGTEYPGDAALEVAVRSADWKLVLRIPFSDRGRHDGLASPDDDTDCFLFNLDTDPSELQSLADAPANTPVRERPRSRLLAWHHNTPWLDLPDGVPGR